MRKFQELKITTNTQLYKRLRKEEITNKTGICSHCRYHRGENITGYCGNNPSWKLTSKTKNQWSKKKKVSGERGKILYSKFLPYM